MAIEFSPVEWKDVVREFKNKEPEYKLVPKPLAQRYDRIPRLQSSDFDNPRNIINYTNLKQRNYGGKDLEYKRKNLEYKGAPSFHDSYGGDAREYQSSTPKAPSRSYIK